MIAKISAIILFLLSFEVYAQNPNSQANQEDELKKHISAAETFQISGDMPNALTENRAIIAIALQRFGNTLIEEGKYRDAAKMLSESKTFGDRTSVRIDLAVAHLRLNEVEKALEEAKAAADSDPKNAYARYILGNIYFTKGDFQAALPELEKVLILAPNFDAARALGIVYLNLKQPERARLLFEEIKSGIKNETADLHILFGQSYEETGYPLEAEREFKRAVAINPKKERANFYLGYLLLLHGGSERLPEAGKYFEAEMKILPEDFYATFFAGVVASSENDHRKAVGLLEKAILMNPKSIEAHLFLGQSQIENGDFKSAEKNLRRSLELTSNDSKNGYQIRRAFYLLGRLLIQDGRREEGEKMLLKARELQSQLIKTTRDEITQLFSQVVNTTEKSPAIILSDRSLNLSPERTAELKKSKSYLSDVLAQAFYNLGVIAVQYKRTDEALEKFTTAAKWNADFPGLNRTLGIINFNEGRLAEAIAPLEKHLKTAPNDNLARQMLGTSYHLTGNFKKTVEILKPVAALPEINAELKYFYGIALIQTEDFAGAKTFFESLAKSSRQSDDALYYAGQGFMFLGDYERAAAEFTGLLKVSPQKAKANFFRGQSLIRLNRFDEAEKAFRNELELNPVDESSKYHLALTLIERKIGTDEAISLLQDAIRLKSDYADALYQLGKIYIEKGETEKAIENLEAAARSDDKKDYIHYQLSIAYRKASRREDADRELKLYQQLKSANRKTDAPMPMGNNGNSPK